MPRNSNRPQGNPGARSNVPREIVILGFFCSMVVVLFCALIFRTIVDADYTSSLADGQHQKTTVDYAKRGTIYDRNGEVIASSIESTTINVNPKQIDYVAAVSDEQKASMTPAAEAVAQLFYKYLGKKYDKTYDEYYQLVTKTGTGYVIIQRRCDKDVADSLKEALDEAQLQGVYYESDTTRIYPNENIGSQVIGTVGLKLVDSDNNIVKDEDAQGRTDLTEAYRGTSGLELQYDSILSGVNGSVTQEKSSTGIPIAGGSIVVEKAQDGEDMISSIDIKLQAKAESVIKKAIKEYEAKGGSVTIMDASTGEIYAACSFTKTKKNGKTTYTYDAGKLWSVADSYEPGSTFKSLTAASILSNTKVTNSTTFSVPAKLKVYDSTITDSHERSGTETMSLTKIIADSSNIGTVIASRKTTSKKLYSTYKKFGIGQSTGIDFPGAASGILAKYSDWDGVQAANVVFGQGVAVTGVQLVRAYGALEQGGTLRVPHFLVEFPNNDELTEKTTADLKKTSQAAKKKVCKNVTKMMRSVVTSGTGTDAAIKGFKVVGKTGTAEVAGSNGRYISGAYIVSFCGWLEGSDSDLVCLATVEQPKTEEGGGGVCGPVFAEIMSFAADRYQISPNGD